VSVRKGHDFQLPPVVGEPDGTLIEFLQEGLISLPAHTLQEDSLNRRKLGRGHFENSAPGGSSRAHTFSATNSRRSPRALATACTVDNCESRPNSISRTVLAFGIPARLARAYQVKP